MKDIKVTITVPGHIVKEVKRLKQAMKNGNADEYEDGAFVQNWLDSQVDTATEIVMFIHYMTGTK